MDDSRRTALKYLTAIAGGASLGASAAPTLKNNFFLEEAYAQDRAIKKSNPPGKAMDKELQAKVKASVKKGLQWLSRSQKRLGNWAEPTYPTAISALAGTALICSGSTTMQGPHAKKIRNTVDYLLSKCCENGHIGDPLRDNRYTYGHGFSMLFLSQVLGEEEDVDRRDELVRVLTKAVQFTKDAQTKAGGWGYVSAKEGNNFDEGSTTITQVQGLRACRNAGIPVSDEVIDKAKEYIYFCKNPDGGIAYSSTSRGSGSRLPITAAALAALYNAGAYDSEHVPDMLKICREKLYDLTGESYGHWHYCYLYYAQVVYRQGGEEWSDFRDRICKKILDEQAADGSWPQGNVGAVYVTSCNLIILQLDNGFLPIYQR